MAEQMREENYSVKAPPTCGHSVNLWHTRRYTGASLLDGIGRAEVGGCRLQDSKFDLVAALKDSSAMCDAAFDSLTDATAGQPGGMGRSKLALLEYTTGNSNEEYGYTSVYMRLKGLVQPSSAGKKQ